MKKAVTVALLISLGAALAGCDVHRAEREDVERRIASIAAQMQQTRDRVAVIDVMLAERLPRLASVQEELRRVQRSDDALKQAAAEYMLEHKLATAAALTTVAGLDRLTGEMPDDERSAIAVVTALGAGYCLFNISECADVAGRLGAFASRSKTLGDQASVLGDTQGALQKEIASLQAERETRAGRVATLVADADAQRERAAALACRFPRCI